MCTNICTVQVGIVKRKYEMKDKIKITTTKLIMSQRPFSLSSLKPYCLEVKTVTSRNYYYYYYYYYY